jgi:hypothetical protein
MLEGGKMSGWLKTNIIGTSMKDSAKEFKWFIIVAENNLQLTIIPYLTNI